MALRVEHEMHSRRRSRNFGVLAVLLVFVGIVFGLTVVKVTQLGNASQFERFDHAPRPQLIPQEGEAR